MKSVTFNRKSWHFWLATKVADYSEESEDFCAYVRSVLFGAAMIFLMASFVAFCLYAIGREFHSLYTCVIAGWFGIQAVCSYGDFEKAALGVESVIGGFMLIAFLAIKYVNWRDERKYKNRDKEPGFVKIAYRNFKEKTCKKVEFK